MKRKALLCALAALTLLFSAQPAAAALTSNQRSTEIKAETRLPIINVIVPASVNIMINPYRMPVQIGGEESDETIVCSPAYILSTSDIPLKVDITVTGSVYPESDMVLVTSPTHGAGTGKNAFVYFEMQQNNTEYWDEVVWASSYDSTKHIVITKGGSTTKKGIVTLPPLTLDGELAANAYTWFRLSGDAVRMPASEWNTQDGINVTIAFTFTPQSYV